MLEVKLPSRFIVSKIIDARYAPGTKPQVWEERRPGVERVANYQGDVVTLYSTGGQATPAPGWEILLEKFADGVDLGEGFAKPIKWTLYGIK